MHLPVTLLSARVITQHVLLRQIGGDLIEREIELIRCLRKIDSAAGLSRQLFHPALCSKRAQLWREDLEGALKWPVGFAMVDKRRSAGLVGGTELVAGDVQGATVLLFDDLIATGTTLQRAARALRRAGATRVVACAAHGLFVGSPADTLGGGGIDHVLVTDSVPTFRLPPGHPARRLLKVVSCVPLLAEAIRDSCSSWAR